MTKNFTLKKSLTVGIIIIFICSSFVSSISGYTEETNQLKIVSEETHKSQEEVFVNCQTFGLPGKPTHERSIPLSDAELLYEKIQELQFEVARDPFSDNIHHLQKEIITIAQQHDLLPKGLSTEKILTRLTPINNANKPIITLPRAPGRASEMFCNYVSTGSGSSLPIIILPRLIPILLTPIPRLFVRWSTYEGITSCGGMRSKTGFIATGAQNGIALGFWGIGFSIFLPPVMAYGLLGYALYASVNAEEIEWWPPNNPPIISNENPPNGVWNVPISLNELSFQINDTDNELMGYTVKTNPDIGSGGGTNKGNGMYTIPVSELQSNTQYQWIVEVADSKDVTIREFSFTTEELPFDPFVEGWQYRKKITIDHTQVDSDLSYFPLLVSIVDSDLRDKVQNDGDDILFMNDEGVAHKLYHEIEHYDDTTGELVAWVTIPAVLGDEDTIFYMYYGNSTSNSQQVPERVWDAHYCGVWHLDNFLDSTNNGNDGTNHGTDDCIGKIGNAKDFIRANKDYIDLGDIPEPANNKITTATFEMWINPDDFDAGNHLIYKANTGDYEPDRKSYGFVINGERKIGFGLYCGTWYPEGNRIYFYTNESYGVAGSWQHVSVAVDLSEKKAKIYYNGEEKDNTITIYGTPPAYFYDINYPEEFGRIVGESSTGRYNGGMDEVRISKVWRSSDWISTEYNNQNDPSSFFSIGPQETGP